MTDEKYWKNRVLIKENLGYIQYNNTITHNSPIPRIILDFTKLCNGISAQKVLQRVKQSANLI